MAIGVVGLVPEMAVGLPATAARRLLRAAGMVAYSMLRLNEELGGISDETPMQRITIQVSNFSSFERNFLSVRAFCADGFASDHQLHLCPCR